MAFQETEITDAAGGRWVQWVDRAKADGWARRLGELARLDPSTTDLAAQVAATRELWEALAAFYQSVDLPPQADPAYVRAWVARDAGSPYRGAGVWRTTAFRHVLRESEDAREAAADNEPFTLDLAKRITLSDRATVDAALLAATQAPPTARGVDYTRSGCLAGQTSVWSCWIWSEWWPGAFTASDGAVVAVPPVGDFWRLAADVATAVADAGSLGTVARARRWTAVTNLRNARDAGASLPEDLVALAADDAVLRSTLDPDLTEAAEVTALLAGAVVAATALPFAGALLGLLAAAPAALQAIFGRATGSSVDAFGRRMPRYQPTAISGSLAPRLAPTQDPPAAPWRPVELPPPLVVVQPPPEVLPLERQGQGDGLGLLVAAAALVALAASSRR